MPWPQIFLADAGGLVGAIITAAVALVGALLLYRSTLRVARRNLLVGTITTERAVWRSELRTLVASLHTVVQAALDKPCNRAFAELDANRTAIRLRLNPSRDPKHRHDIAISDALCALRSAVHQRQQVPAWTELKKIEVAAQALIKQEWEKSKTEADQGELIS